MQLIANGLPLQNFPTYSIEEFLLIRQLLEFTQNVLLLGAEMIQFSRILLVKTSQAPKACMLIACASDDVATRKESTKPLKAPISYM